MTENRKITLATLKAFIKKNEPNILINVKSCFDGMTDGVEYLNGGFEPLKRSEPKESGFAVASDNTLGFNGVWLVGSSRDYITAYNENGLRGFEVSNSCGKWIVAIPMIAEVA